MIKTIIFDFAGVITEKTFGGWEKIADRFNLDKKLTKQLYYEHVEEYGRGGSTQDFINNVCPDGTIDREEFESLYQNWWTLNPEIVSLIKKLRKKYRVIMFTDNFEPCTKSIRGNMEIMQLFNESFFSNELGFIKKDQNSFEIILQTLGALPEDCVFIDDNDGPIKSARATGIASIKYLNYNQLISELKKLGL